MASFGYTLRKSWRKKRDDIRQARYTRQHDEKVAQKPYLSSCLLF